MAFFDNIKFPFFTMQELNLDWLLKEVKRIAGFMPQDGNVGDVLTRKSDGAEWEPPDAVNININALPEDTAITDNDQLVFYDISASANRKIKPPNLLDSMMSNGTPLMDGTASPGTSKKPARYDHKHPTDTSRQAALTGVQMNAVNSGASANSFSSGILNVANGGTGVSSMDGLATALKLHGLIAIQEFQYATDDTQSASYHQYTISCHKDGYTPLGIVSWRENQVIYYVMSARITSGDYLNIYTATRDGTSITGLNGWATVIYIRNEYAT